MYFLENFVTIFFINSASVIIFKMLTRKKTKIVYADNHNEQILPIEQLGEIIILSHIISTLIDF